MELVEEFEAFLERNENEIVLTRGRPARGSQLELLEAMFDEGVMPADYRTFVCAHGAAKVQLRRPRVWDGGFEVFGAAEPGLGLTVAEAISRLGQIGQVPMQPFIPVLAYANFWQGGADGYVPTGQYAVLANGGVVYVEPYDFNFGILLRDRIAGFETALTMPIRR